MQLALLMIVRNEEVALPHLLASVRPYIDSWVIHDTGSTDRTPQIVEEMLAGIPGRLERRPWQDFGANRTALLAECPESADYALLLDADHVLQVHDPDWLAAGRSGTWPDADCLLISVEGGPSRYRMPYLVRRRPDYRYEGRTHEVLRADGELLMAEFDAISVLHTELGGSKQAKTERDLALLRADIADAPTSRAHFYLAQTLLAAGEAEQAIEHYRIAESLPASPEAIYYCALMRGRILLGLERLEPALAAFEQARAAYGRRAEAHLDAARVLAHLGRHGEALVLLQEAKSRGPQRGVLFIEDWVTDWGIDLELATALWWTGDKVSAREMFRQLGDRAGLPEWVRERVRQNLTF